jgi:hypothetical protein
MGNDKEQKPCISANSHEGCNDCSGGRRCYPRHQNNNYNNNPNGKFRGKTEEIATDTFNITGPHDATMFNKSQKNVANYLQLNHGNDISEVVCIMLPVVITIPNQPTDKTDPMDSTKTLLVPDVDLNIWKREYSKAHDCKDKYDENMAKTYIVIYHQCSPTLKNDFKAAPIFATVHSN